VFGKGRGKQVGGGVLVGAGVGVRMEFFMDGGVLLDELGLVSDAGGVVVGGA
jgi:hypothetical protein